MADRFNSAWAVCTTGLCPCAAMDALNGTWVVGRIGGTVAQSTGDQQ